MAPDSTSGLLVDGLVVFLYFAVIIAIGLYKGRGSKDLESFAVGNRSIPWWAVLASILAAEISAATFLGAPGEGSEKRNLDEEYGLGGFPDHTCSCERNTALRRRHCVRHGLRDGKRRDSQYLATSLDLYFRALRHHRIDRCVYGAWRH